MIIAQGAEAGGFGGTVSTLSLVPKVIDAVSPIPVVAAGGIADGRGLAAALVLGAQGVNIGTRFLAPAEAEIDDEWKRRILAAKSGGAVKVEFADHVFPAPNVEAATGPCRGCCARPLWRSGTGDRRKPRGKASGWVAR